MNAHNVEVGNFQVKYFEIKIAKSLAWLRDIVPDLCSVKTGHTVCLSVFGLFNCFFPSYSIGRETLNVICSFIQLCK